MLRWGNSGQTSVLAPPKAQVPSYSEVPGLLGAGFGGLFSGGIFASAVKLQRIDSGGRLRTMYIDWAPSSEIRDTCQFFKVSILDARYPVTTA